MLSLFIVSSFDEFAIVNNLTFATLCPLALDGSTISEAEQCQYQIQRIGENYLGLCVRNLNTSDAPWVTSAIAYHQLQHMSHLLVALYYVVWQGQLFLL